MTDETSKALLVILDGFGIAENPSVSAIERANTPFIDSLFRDHPHSQLKASGPAVGLPEGQFGNSEVGHLNIGAGRIVWQELSRINNAITDGSFYSNDVLNRAFDSAKDSGRIHFMGLFSDGGVHSHNNHLFALLKMAKRAGIDQTYVHAFSDGRDTSPTGGLDYSREFEKEAQTAGTGTIASIIGRYFAMDRDNRWERTEKAYNLLVHGTGTHANSVGEAFQSSYEAGKTDEFIEPQLIQTEDNSRIQPGDTVIFYNIRGDRARQILKALLSFEEVPFETPDLGLNLFSFTSYEDVFNPVIGVAWPPATFKNTIGEYINSLGLQQLRVAETEKYPHVTYFFNGGEESPNDGEERLLIPSPKVATYDLQPEMSAQEVTDRLCEKIQTEIHQLIILNYANPDMVGHTGVMEAAVKAVETIDTQLERTVKAAKQHGYSILIIADHGNVDCMIQPDGSPHTAHTTAPVPAILITEENATMHNGILADVSPTLLKMMGLSQPSEMTGKPLY